MTGFEAFKLHFVYFVSGNEALLAGKLLNSNTCVTGHIVLVESTIDIRLRSSSDRLLEQLILFVEDNQF